jgi:hypothetical protein
MSSIAGTASQRAFRLGPLWPTDTKSIVGSVLLAVCFSINMQITERLDTLTGVALAPLTGAPIANWLGFMFINMWFPIAVIYFGMTGALIVANFNPVLAVLTATHPLAWSFFFLNMCWSVPNTLVFRSVLARGEELSSSRFISMCAVGQFIASVGFSVLMLIVFPGAQWWAYIIIPLWNFIMVIPGGVIGYWFFNSVRRSGVLE